MENTISSPCQYITNPKEPTTNSSMCWISSATSTKNWKTRISQIRRQQRCPRMNCSRRLDLIFYQEVIVSIYFEDLIHLFFWKLKSKEIQVLFQSVFMGALWKNNTSSNKFLIKIIKAEFKKKRIHLCTLNLKQIWAGVFLYFSANLLTSSSFNTLGSSSFLKVPAPFMN